MHAFLAIIGASGAGKSTIIEELEKTGRYEYIRPLTTRPARPGETHKVSVPDEEFHRLRKEGGLFCVNQVYGNWYAYPRSIVQRILREGKTPVCDLIIDAIDSLRSEVPDMQVVTIYIMPPSLEELRARLEKSGRFNEARFMKDQADMQRAKTVPGIDHFVVNDSVQRAAQEILSYF